MSYRKLVVLEGPDGSGKSTLAAAMVETLTEAGYATAVVHGGPPDPADSQPMATLVRNALQEFKDHSVVIMDRSPLSELIYGPLLRGKAVGSSAEWAAWDKLVAGGFGSFDLDLFVLDAPDDVLVRRAYQDRGEDYVPSELFLNVVHEYRRRHEELESKGWRILYSMT